MPLTNCASARELRGWLRLVALGCCAVSQWTGLIRADDAPSNAAPKSPPAKAGPAISLRTGPAEATAGKSEARITGAVPAETPSSTDPVVRATPMPDPAKPAAKPTNPAPPTAAAGKSSGGLAKIEAASFKGIQPGHSNRVELNEEWGSPKEIRKVKGIVQQSYEVESFEKVTVSIKDGIVSSIVIYLKKPMEADTLAKQLQIDDVETVLVTDDAGTVLGEAFPERGVLCGFAPDQKTPQVSQILLEPIDPETFLLRAERNLARPARSLADVDYALKLNGKLARGHDLRARIVLAEGDIQEATRSAEAAIAIAPDEPSFHLTMGQLLFQAADYDGAGREAKKVADASKAPASVKARAHCLSGDCLAASAGGQFALALKQHVEAVKQAGAAREDKRAAERRAAKEVVLDAYLAVANDIAFGNWQQKSTVVPKWLARANACLDDLMANEQGDESLPLRLYAQSLSALAGVPDAPDPARWIDPARKLGQRLIDGATDPAAKSRLQWQLGLALDSAMQVEHARHEHRKSLEYGQQASHLLFTGQKAAEQLPGRDFLVGRLYYRLGATQAVELHDHKQAITWYKRAVPLLESPVPASALTDPGRQGEMFVSMAVSFWEQHNREESMRLTRQGVKLMEQGVADGSLQKGALAVPYSNLATMHKDLGDERQAKEFAELAARSEQTSKK